MTQNKNKNKTRRIYKKRRISLSLKKKISDLCTSVKLNIISFFFDMNEFRYNKNYFMNRKKNLSFLRKLAPYLLNWCNCGEDIAGIVIDTLKVNNTLTYLK